MMWLDVCAAGQIMMLGMRIRQGPDSCSRLCLKDQRHVLIQKTQFTSSFLILDLSRRFHFIPKSSLPLRCARRVTSAPCKPSALFVLFFHFMLFHYFLFYICLCLDLVKNQTSNNVNYKCNVYASCLALYGLSASKRRFLWVGHKKHTSVWLFWNLFFPQIVINKIQKD